MWRFERAMILNTALKGADAAPSKEGMLVVTVIDRRTGTEQNSSVCSDSFNWHSAKLICRSIGYVFAAWGSNRMNMKYVTKYVSHLLNYPSR